MNFLIFSTVPAIILAVKLYYDYKRKMETGEYIHPMDSESEYTDGKPVVVNYIEV